jgi:formylglycine-generating enzyme required for sulfatase activity
MVNITAGTFTANGTLVTMSAFKMGKYEVTQEQWEYVMGSGPSYFSDNPASGEEQDKRPVEQVTWYDAIEFCNILSEKEGLQQVYTMTVTTRNAAGYITAATVTADFTRNGYRLPTDAQWEYACRAGTTTVYSNGEDTDTNLGDVAWYSVNSGNTTHPVGQKAANEWGLYDMHGNVSEWCWDWYGSYTAEDKTDPTGASSGPGRIRRGGNYASNDALYLRSANRDYLNPVSRYNYHGFRLVRP